MVGSARDLVTSTLADSLVPMLRRPLEDIVFEAIDKRELPSKADVQLAADDLRAKVEAFETRILQLEALESRLPAVEEIEARLAAIEARLADLEEGRLPPEPAPLSQTERCKVPDCEEPYRSQGFCARHYQKWRRGTLEGFPYPE